MSITTDITLFSVSDICKSNYRKNNKKAFYLYVGDSLCPWCRSVIEQSIKSAKENEIDEYLHKTFDGKKNNSGCLFEDVLSDENFCGMHDMIFGHNMKDGSMVGSLKKIHSPENGKILEDNPYVYINTGDTIYRYEAFAYEIPTAGSGAYCEVKDNDEYDAFIEYVISNDQWDNDKKYNFESRPSILTLSTCSGFAGGNRRFVIHTYKESEKKIR